MPKLSMLLTLIGIIFRSVAYDPLDPSGNITIKWDIVNWTADGYEVCADVTSEMKSFLF